MKNHFFVKTVTGNAEQHRTLTIIDANVPIGGASQGMRKPLPA